MADIDITTIGNDITVTSVEQDVVVTVTQAPDITVQVDGGINGAAQFTDLSDVPHAYTGQGGKILAVKSDVSGLEFVAASVGSGDYTDEQAQDAVGTILSDSTTIDFTYTDGTPAITAAVLPAGVDHDSLLNFVANEHIDWTSDQGATNIHAGNIPALPYVAENVAITGSTKTKVTYDAKGLITSGADATTADIADSTNKRYVSDAQLVVIGNTSGTNTGNQTSVSGNAGTATKLATARAINGVDFDGSQAITVYDSTKLADVVGDTTPQLGGDLDCQNNTIDNAKTVQFNGEVDNGSKTTHFTVTWNNGQKQKATLSANTMTITLGNPTSVGNFVLKLVNGGLATKTWAATSGAVYWVGGTAPTLTNSGTDLIMFYYDGTNFYGAAMLAFA
jgi:hypothetical protein